MSCSIWYLLNFLRQTRPRMETLVVGLLPRGPEDGTDSAVRTVCASAQAFRRRKLKLCTYC